METQYTPNKIPNFVTALTPMGLRKAMLMNNSKLGMYVHYYDIQQITLNGKLSWIAWFNVLISDNEVMNEMVGVK